MGLCLVAVAEPVFAGNGDVEQGGTEVNKRNVETAAIEGDNGIEMFGGIPKRGEQFAFVNARNILDGSSFIFLLGIIVGGEEDFASLGICIEHGDANDARGE